MAVKPETSKGCGTATGHLGRQGICSSWLLLGQGSSLWLGRQQAAPGRVQTLCHVLPGPRWAAVLGEPAGLGASGQCQLCERAVGAGSSLQELAVNRQHLTQGILGTALGLSWETCCYFKAEVVFMLRVLCCSVCVTSHGHEPLPETHPGLC